MRYTGNPNLKPYKCYDFGVSYQWLPNNKFNFAAFATGFIATNRFAYVYEASADGIIRTVQQPMGKFIEGRYGINGTARLLDGNLQINGQLAHYIAKNEQPFNWTKISSQLVSPSLLLSKSVAFWHTVPIKYVICGQLYKWRMGE